VATGIGRNMGEKDIYLSDFMRVLAKETGIPATYFLHFWTKNDWFPNAYKCDIDYFKFLKDPYISKNLGLGTTYDSMGAFLTKYIGEDNAKKVMELKDGEPNGKCPSEFLFFLFSWPDKHTMDYEETKGLDLDILTRDKKVLRYWDGVIRNEKLSFL